MAKSAVWEAVFGCHQEPVNSAKGAKESKVPSTFGSAKTMVFSASS